MMKGLMILGIVLILGGVAGLVLGHISYTTEEKVVDLGPITATADREHTIKIPDIAAVAALVAGAFLVFVGRRR
ncbi:MAG TPA: hypothetical protein VM639_23430 [Dongiaceae bacterium]|nr:hypothetical protein [Dongiaceae bacterium]